MEWPVLLLYSTIAGMIAVLTMYVRWKNRMW
jgi:hypothetical protein